MNSLISIEKSPNKVRNEELPFSNIHKLDDLQEKEYRGQLGDMKEWHQLLKDKSKALTYGKLLGVRCLSQPKLRLTAVEDQKHNPYVVVQDLQSEIRDELKLTNTIGKFNMASTTRILNPDIESVKNLEIWAIDKVITETTESEDYKIKLRTKIDRRLEESNEKFLSYAASQSNELIANPAKELLILLKQKAAKNPKSNKDKFMNTNSRLQDSWKAMFEKSKQRAIRGYKTPKESNNNVYQEDEKAMDEEFLPKGVDVEMILANTKEKKDKVKAKRELTMNHEIDMEMKVQHLKNILGAKKCKQERIKKRNKELKETIQKLHAEIVMIKKELGLITPSKILEHAHSTVLRSNSPGNMKTLRTSAGKSILKSSAGINHTKQPLRKKPSFQRVNSCLRDTLSIIRTNKEKLNEFFIKKNSDISLLEGRIISNKREMVNYQKKMHYIKGEMQEIRQTQVEHYLSLIEEGSDSRNQGLSWIIKAIWYLGFDVDMQRLPSFLDNISVRYLFNTAKLEISVEEILKELREKRNGKDDGWLFNTNQLSNTPQLKNTPLKSINEETEKSQSPKKPKDYTSLSTIGNKIHKSLQRGNYQVVSETPNYIRNSIMSEKVATYLLPSILSPKYTITDFPNEIHLDQLEKKIKHIRKEIKKKRNEEIERISKKFIIGNYSTKYGATEEKILIAVVGEETMKKELEKRNRTLETTRKTFHSNRNFTFGRSNIIHTSVNKQIDHY